MRLRQGKPASSAAPGAGGRSWPSGVRDRRLAGEQVIRECFDGLTDLQQADANSVEYQAVGQVTALQVGTDRIDRGLDIYFLPRRVSSCRAPRSFRVRVVQRLLALDACIWHNWQIGAPVKRSLTMPRPPLRDDFELAIWS